VIRACSLSLRILGPIELTLLLGLRSTFVHCDGFPKCRSQLGVKSPVAFSPAFLHSKHILKEGNHRQEHPLCPSETYRRNLQTDKATTFRLKVVARMSMNDDEELKEGTKKKLNAFLHASQNNPKVRSSSLKGNTKLSCHKIDLLVLLSLVLLLFPAVSADPLVDTRVRLVLLLCVLIV